MPDAPTPTPADRAQVLADAQLALLGRLAEIGLELAEFLKADVAGMVQAAEVERASLITDVHVMISTPPLLFSKDVALTYGRISRAVRLTLALQTRILRGLERRARDPRAQAPSRTTPAPASLSEADPIDAEPRERLSDRPDAPDALNQPFAEVVAQIYRDLGLSDDAAARKAGAWPPPTRPWCPAAACESSSAPDPGDGETALGRPP